MKVKFGQAKAGTDHNIGLRVRRGSAKHCLIPGPWVTFDSSHHPPCFQQEQMGGKKTENQCRAETVFPKGVKRDCQMH